MKEIGEWWSPVDCVMPNGEWHIQYVTTMEIVVCKEQWLPVYVVQDSVFNWLWLWQTVSMLSMGLCLSFTYRTLSTKQNAVEVYFTSYSEKCWQEMNTHMGMKIGRLAVKIHKIYINWMTQIDPCGLNLEPCKIALYQPQLPRSYAKHGYNTG